MKKNVKKNVARKSSLRGKRHIVPALRIFFISTSVAAVVALFVSFNKPAIKQSVQGISIVKGMYNEGMVSWQPVAGAVSYNIYYGLTTDATFTNSVREIPADATSYTIQYLKKDTNYTYQVSAVGVDIYGNKTETWFSPITPLTNMQGM
ncbi:MAG TPA: fibronectin type III domain-containing protein [Candidatus Saccharimonadales bacterium]|nr:fibronectin type III domain-containing protein [Candidatus Saccharimonadales bacterium]